MDPAGGTGDPESAAAGHSPHTLRSAARPLNGSLSRRMPVSRRACSSNFPRSAAVAVPQHEQIELLGGIPGDVQRETGTGRRRRRGIDEGTGGVHDLRPHLAEGRLVFASRFLITTCTAAAGAGKRSDSPNARCTVLHLLRGLPLAIDRSVAARVEETLRLQVADLEEALPQPVGSMGWSGFPGQGSGSSTTRSSANSSCPMPPAWRRSRRNVRGGAWEAASDEAAVQSTSSAAAPTILRFMAREQTTTLHWGQHISGDRSRSSLQEDPPCQRKDTQACRRETASRQRPEHAGRRVRPRRDAPQALGEAPREEPQAGHRHRTVQGPPLGGGRSQTRKLGQAMPEQGLEPHALLP